MEKEWSKIAENEYVLAIDKTVVGRMEISTSRLPYHTFFKMGESIFYFQKNNRKNQYEIQNQEKEVILKIYPEKWYSSTLFLETEDKMYRLKTRNNPLVELALLDEEKTLLAYGLEASKGAVYLRITTVESRLSPLFDALLFFLALPFLSSETSDPDVVVII